MTDAARSTRDRPLSPHLQVWRWHITMLCSILHRATGVALYGGALILAAWAVSLAAGPEAYDLYMKVMGSWLGRLVMLGLSASAFYHLASGVRHLVWDTGHGLDIKSANSASLLSLIFTVAATVAAWVLAYAMGAL